MKIINKNNALLILAVITILIISSHSSNNVNIISNVKRFDDYTIIDDILEETLIETYGENYEEALEKNAAATLLSEELIANFETESNGDILYPDYYGGQYINDSNELVVQIVSSTKASLKITSYDVIVEYVKNSYSELESVNNSIINYFSNENSELDNFVANYIDVINNKVVVELTDNSSDYQLWFKSNILDSDLIEFIETDNQTISTSSYNTGDYFLGCTIGYRAKLSGIEGFVTAGHCVSDYSVGTIFGNYGTLKSYTVSGSIDAAFIALGSSNSVSNTLTNSAYKVTSLNTTTAASTYYTVGTALAKSGQTTGSTLGKITNANYSVTVDDIYFTKQVLTSALCNNGDSGGPVYAYTTTGTTGTLLGITHAKQVTGDISNAGYMIFSRADLINSQLGLTRY